MTDQFIRDRITALRIKKGVSEYKMSLDLGHSGSYVKSISSGRSLPPLKEFLYICEYLGVTPRDFFDEDLKNPALLQQAMDSLKALSDDDITLIMGNMKRLQDK
ncbi:MAG: helix-turn-helix domain-containing protein [Oscillospiraceae bacterium]|jgi:transcriptional regulator with XRE-family HTH domain|nr:helix-turn-helix domain-containing protein [Oscillospiraceae bacterium]